MATLWKEARPGRGGGGCSLTALTPPTCRVAVFDPAAPSELLFSVMGKLWGWDSGGCLLGEVQGGLRGIHSEKVEDCIQFPYACSVCPCSANGIFLNEFLAESLTPFKSHSNAKPKGTYCSSGSKWLFYWQRCGGHFKRDNEPRALDIRVPGLPHHFLGCLF